MFRHLLLAAALTNALFTAPASTAQNKPAVKEYTRADFISVEGANLNDKLTRAVAQFKATKQGESCWLAWHFPIMATPVCIATFPPRRQERCLNNLVV